MTSQFEHHLLPPFKSAAPQLLSALRSRSPVAERQALVDFNATRTTRDQVKYPKPGPGYEGYATTHLALLWRQVQNVEALTVVASRLRARLRPPASPLTTPEALAAFYANMPRPVLRCLWTTVGDPDAFRVLLRQGERAAINILINRWNAMPNRAEEMPTPAPRRYADFPPVLLALLGSIGGNANALRELAKCESVAPLPPSIQDWPLSFLERLWTLARDADALAELWRREGLDVNAPINGDTPPKVLGYRWCFYQDTTACEALLNRYRRMRVPEVDSNRAVHRQDHRANRNVLVLEQIPNWDFRVFADLASWIRTVELNARIDDGRRARRGPRPPIGGEDDNLPDAEDQSGARLLAAIERQDELDARAPWRQVVVHKLKEGFPLKPRELELIALDILRNKNNPNPTTDEVQAAIPEVCRRVEELRADGVMKPLSTVLPGYKPVRHSQLKRISKLRLRHDAANQAIRGVADLATADAFGTTLADFDVLFGRSKGEAWQQEPSPAAFVERLDLRIREALGRAAQTGADSTALDRCRVALNDYLREFPLLVKAAHVRRLVTAARQARPTLEVLDEILVWIDGGRNWLSTLREADALRCKGFIEKLTREAFDPELAMLTLWLRSICTPGRPHARLVDLDEARRVVCPENARRLADDMVRAALAGNTPRVAAAAVRMHAAVDDLPSSWGVRRLRGCLVRLGSKRTREAALLELCRKLAGRGGERLPTGLAAWLEADGCLGDGEGPTSVEGHALRLKLRQMIDPTAAPSPDGSVRLLLDLALGALLGAGMPALTAESLCVAWEACHSDHGWSKDIPPLADELTAAAWRAFEAWTVSPDWSTVAKAAKRLRKLLLHCDDSPKAVREEVERALGRLARGPRTRPPASLTAGGT